jgi:hypothetical protein
LLRLREITEKAEPKAQLDYSRLMEQGDDFQLQGELLEVQAAESDLQSKHSKSGELEFWQAQIREIRADGGGLQSSVGNLKGIVADLLTRLQAVRSARPPVERAGGLNVEVALLSEWVAEHEAKMNALAPRRRTRRSRCVGFVVLLSRRMGSAPM